MTKRTVEQAVRDDLAAAEDEVARRVGLVEKARLRFVEVNGALDAARTDLVDAEARVIRARNALAAITGKTLEELLDETKARAARTGTHDPADVGPWSPEREAEELERIKAAQAAGELPVDETPEVVSPLRKKAPK